MAQRKTGVILVNLGTPKSPTPASVRKFLREFLSDRRVVDAPRFFWPILLNTVIVPLRSRRVARAYESIWTGAGSPLRKYSQELAEGLCASGKIRRAMGGDDPTVGECKLDEDCTDGPGDIAGSIIVGETVGKAGVGAMVTWAMTYGEPAIETRVDEFLDRGIDRILVLPLYPQFSSTTTGAVYDRLFSLIKTRRNIPDFRCVHDYHDHPRYIDALAISVEKHWANYDRSERLLMSFHGLPQSYVKVGDPYIKQCRKTASLLANKLKLGDDEWVYSFQSRFGPAKWVKPYTNESLIAWAQEGVKNVDVICPSFSTDCLETLEEVGKQYAELFRRSGGENLFLIPCLNSTQAHLDLLEELIIQNNGQVNRQVS